MIYKRKLIALVFCFLMVEAAAAAVSPADSVLTLNYRLSGGPAYAIVASETHLFYNSGGNVLAATVEGGTAATVVGRLELGFIPADIRLHGDFLLLRNYEDRLVMVEIGDPSNMRVLTDITLKGGRIFDWTIFGENLYLAQGDGIKIFRIEPQGTLEKQAEYSNICKGFAGALAVEGERLYVCGEGELLIFDISVPAEAQLLQRVPISGKTSSLLVRDGWVFLISRSLVRELSPAAENAWQVTSEVELNCSAEETMGRLSGNRLFLLCRGIQLSVWDVSVPGRLRKLSENKSAVYDFDVAGEWVFTANRFYIEAGRVGEAGEWDVLWQKESGALLNQIEVAGDFLLLNFDDKNPQLFERSSGEPIELSEWLPPGTYRVWDTRVCRFSGDSLQVYDFSDPHHPVALGGAEVGFIPQDAALHGSYLYLSHYRRGLKIFDLSVSGKPAEVVDLPVFNLGRIQINGNSLYGESITSFYRYDLSDPLHPELAGRYNPGGFITDFSVQAGWAWLCVDEAGLHVLDLSQPGDPLLLKWYPGRFSGCLAADSYLLCTPGLKIFDAADPARLELKTALQFDDFWGGVQDVQVYGSQIFVAEENLGVFVYQNRLLTRPPRTTYISSPYPNPFNSTVTIRYTLKRESAVRLDIFNLQGHHVKSLLQENQLPGEHQSSWDATNTLGVPVASGVYLYRLTTGQEMESRKILLIR